MALVRVRLGRPGAAAHLHPRTHTNQKLPQVGSHPQGRRGCRGTPRACVPPNVKVSWGTKVRFRGLQGLSKLLKRGRALDAAAAPPSDTAIDPLAQVEELKDELDQLVQDCWCWDLLRAVGPELKKEVIAVKASRYMEENKLWRSKS